MPRTVGPFPEHIALEGGVAILTVRGIRRDGRKESRQRLDGRRMTPSTGGLFKIRRANQSRVLSPGDGRFEDAHDGSALYAIKIASTSSPPRR
jgi:hypothetical protein